MTPRSRPAAHAAVAAIAAAALTLTACGAGGRDEGGGGGGDGDGGGGSTVGVTDDAIKIGGTFPLTGVAAPGYSEIPSGAKAYFDHVNAQGGIHGRTIDYVVKDDAYNPTQTTTVTNELVLQEEVFAMVGSLGTPTHSAVVGMLNDEKVPDLFVSSGSIMWGDDPGKRPMTFGWQPDYEVEAKILGEWLKREHPKAKIGLFLQDDDLGADGEAGLRRYVDDQIVGVARYASGNTDVAPQIASLRSSGADLVVGFNTPAYTALSQLAAARIGFDPTWVYTNVGADPSLVGSLLDRFSKGAVEGEGALDGMYTTEYIPSVDAKDDPWTDLWRRVWEEQGKDGDLTNYRIYGMSQAYTFVTALQAAGPDLTRERMIEVIEESGADWQGPAVAPFRYGTDSHLGIAGARVVKVEDGLPVPEEAVKVSDIGDVPVTDGPTDVAEDAPPADGIPVVGKD